MDVKDGKPGYGTLQDGKSKPTFYGVLSVPAPPISDRQTLWYCLHNHTSKDEATRCAKSRKHHLLSEQPSSGGE